MKFLKGYENFGKFKLIGIGSICMNNVKIYSIKDFEKIRDKDFPHEVVKSVRFLKYDDADAIALALVKLDFGELGQYEKFMLGAPTFSHWRLYNKGIEDFSKDYMAKTNDMPKTLIARDVNKIKASLDG